MKTGGSNLVTMVKTLKYKVVELSIVTDKDIEETINSVVRDGWNFDGIQFAMRDSSKRPSMAFLLFTKGNEREG